MRNLALVSAVRLAAVGCGNSTYMLVEKPDTPLKRYESIYLSEMKTDAWLESIPERARPKWKHVLTHAPKLFKQTAEARLAGSFKVVPKPEEGTLIIESELLEFHPGSRASRVFFGLLFGAGTAKMVVLCTVVDSEDMSPIGSAKAIGTVRAGWIGGSAITTYTRSGGGLAGFVLEHH